jgi:hypothetical protein
LHRLHILVQIGTANHLLACLHNDQQFNIFTDKALGKNKLILFEVSENPKEASTKNSPKNAVFLRSELLSP